MLGTSKLLLTSLFLFFATQTFAGLADIIDCTNAEEEDLNTVARHVSNNWNDFENFLERETGMNVKDCMKNRFQSNGKVKCMDDNSGNCNGANAWAIPGEKKIRLCPSFLNRIDDLTTVNSRACLVAIMTHEFAHSCFRMGEVGAEDLDDAAFAYWASTHNVTIRMALVEWINS